MNVCMFIYLFSMCAKTEGHVHWAQNRTTKSQEVKSERLHALVYPKTKLRFFAMLYTYSCTHCIAY